MILDSEWNELWKEKEDLRQKLDLREREISGYQQMVESNLNTVNKVMQERDSALAVIKAFVQACEESRCEWDKDVDNAFTGLRKTLRGAE